MAFKNMFDRSGLKIYSIVFFILVFIIALLPMVFYFSKYTKNPAEFKPQVKNYMTIEVRVTDVSPAVLALIKAGDIEKDYNGEENARIVSVIKVEPQAMGKIKLSDGTSAEFISEKKDIYLSLRVRYDKIGDETVLHTTSWDLKVGQVMMLRFSDYYIRTEIVKVNNP